MGMFTQLCLIQLNEGCEVYKILIIISLRTPRSLRDTKY